MTTRQDDPGPVALVTGAAGGIGGAVVRELVARGARVVAADAGRTAGRELAGSFAVDVQDAAGVEAMVGEIEERIGPVGILVNVAGVLRAGPLLTMAEDDWAAMLGVNVTGVLTVSRAVARRMVGRGSGSIVTVASNAGSVPRVGLGGYAASKAASVMLTKCLGLELAGHGIRCNVVSPGSTDTSMLRSLWPDADGERATLRGAPEHYRVGIPLQKIARPEDVAAAVAFLASDAAGHITMHDLCVDGGASLGA
ncbi:2,3-dihydro-2,3-dihydroxybenzoate dehydrogenase [Blastococcus sp. KM273128]|uniref:2,3-dihydro-2,3-dihydroxybenzoate dehydrogenase n=1 Tax=Blastococcus sp. KM273128 TaxID=2570314 RepID=UPI001F02F880|nr:2,3-dihydro-2,3-dihydroxybenzoate dehydrogenase [Blastococcus sp. KM273128]